MNKNENMHFTDKQFKENAKKAAAEMKRLSKENSEDVPDLMPLRGL